MTISVAGYDKNKMIVKATGALPIWYWMCQYSTQVSVNRHNSVVALLVVIHKKSHKITALSKAQGRVKSIDSESINNLQSFIEMNKWSFR